MKLALAGLMLALTAVAVPMTIADHGSPCPTESSAIPVGDYWISTVGPAIYKESNNKAGLQRGTDSAFPSDLILGPDVVPCSHPDTLIF